MQKSAPKAKKWAGFVCPECRFVFRIHADQSGRGVICPSCNHLLLVPSKGEVAPAASPNTKQYQSLKSSQHNLQKETSPVRAQSKIRKKTNHWEVEEHHKKELLESEGFPWIWITPFILLAFTLIGVFAWYTFSAPSQTEETPKLIVQTPVKPPDEQPNSTLEYNAIEDAIIIKTLIQNILQADDPETAATYVRPTANFTKKWNQFKNSNNVPLAFSSLDSVSKIMSLPNWLSCSYTDTSFNQWTLNLEYTNGKFLVDWDSSVGWNEISWEELKEKKPSTPTLMRVFCLPDSYFNYDFSDEGKYRCVRLESLKSEHVIYGYLPASSPMISKLLPISATNKITPAIVSIRFPENPTTDDQVYIEDTKGIGWILP